MKSVNSTNSQYKKALKLLKYQGSINNARNLKTLELLNYSFILNPLDNIIKLKNFETNLDYAKEELLWYLSGTNKIDFSLKIYNTWKKYSDNGITVNSAYGYRIFNGQWDWIKLLLIKDKETRRAIINLNWESDKNTLDTKDYPCTLSLHFLIRNNKLNLIVNMRSNDIFYGFRNDIYCFTNLQQIMAKELNLKLGLYYHNVGSLHIYENKIKFIKNL